MEIEVGEYVRTIHGEIAIFKGWNNNPKSQWSCKLEFQKNKTWKYCCEEYIKSHSPNIIDLIELGDNVNRSEVVGIKDDYYGVKVVYVDTEIYHDQRLTEDEIVSVITHEQMEEVEYKV